YIWQPNNAGDGNRRRPLPTMIGENLKSAFDERSIFPKYILDYEAKQKQLFESGVQQPTINLVSTGGNNANSQQLARPTGDAVVKF
ncbi:unnamed protein product, partial [Rotaria magnacalcarata]